MIYYVDPQSYQNLAVYDHSLLSNMAGADITYYANVRYDHLPLPNVKMRKVFSYSGCSNPLAKILSYTRSMVGILLDARRERPTVIHIQWIRFWPLDFLLVFLMHLLGIKVIHTAHNVLPHTRHAGDSTMYRLYYKAVDRIIVHSERTKRELDDLSGCAAKTCVIHHGVLASACDMDQCNRRMEELRQRHGLNSSTVVFACLGLQNKYKGTDMVFKAWKDSKVLCGSDSALLVVGKNENIDYSVVEGMSNVHIVNEKVPELDFNAYMRLSSVILLPYVKISQSGVLFSALQAGVPIMVTDVGGLAEPLKVARVGWNIGAPSVCHLQAAMEQLYTDRRQIDEIRQDYAAFESVRKAYDWSGISAQTMELYGLAKS